MNTNCRASAQKYSLLLGLAGLVSACDSQVQGTGPESNGSLMTLVSALQGAVAACADSANKCELASADAGASQCRDEFATCRDAAKESAKADMDHKVKPCADTFKSCQDAAASAEDKHACSDALHACLGEDDADASTEHSKPDDADGGAAHGSPSPVIACITALHTCIEGDAPAHDCTDALRECIAGAVGHNGNDDAGRPDDNGKPDDAGKPDHPDASKADAPGQDADAGQGGGPDQGGDKLDAGKPDNEGKMPDAGMGPEDSKACKEAREQCHSDGGDPMSCARMRKECRG